MATRQAKPRDQQTTPNLYLAIPPAGAGPGVLVLHAWWGLIPFFRHCCDRLAHAGFVAAAPDLYHGAIATTIAEAQRLRATLKRPVAFQTILQAAHSLQTHPAVPSDTIGSIGFSLGGHYALWLAEQPTASVSATVTFYGTRGGDYTQSRSAFLGHFAEHDAWVAASGVRKLERTLRAAGREATFHTYPDTAHWFAEEDRPDVYHAEAAQLAWQRTITFLRAHVH